ncbi:MAG: MXAN_5187 C-terminal domain-containing protein [Polyangiaceae bacterium]
MQADRLKTGVMDRLQVARFRGSYRTAAQNLNQGMDRAIEKAGGVTRKPADLESILGPMPAQPAMSAFSFPMAAGVEIPAVPPSAGTGGPASSPSRPTPISVSKETPPVFVPTVFNAGNAPAPPPRQAPPLARQAAPSPQAPRVAPASPPLPSNHGRDDDDEATKIGAVPAELMAQATGENRGVDQESAEWFAVFEDFVRTKKQCGEPTDGLTFEKFSQTLKKNRDSLVARHGCKRVRFSVYVKEGKASLKATPVKD